MDKVIKLPISLVIVSFNNASFLDRCIRAASFCAEIIVVDSGSTDGTVAVAEKHGARVFHREWSGYGEQKNFACVQASQHWILCVDQDEIVSEQLRESIVEAFKKEPECDAFDLNRHGVYAGKMINHSGWYPQWRTFLFRKGVAEWSGIEPHVVIDFKGKTKKKLAGDLMHFTYRSIDEHLDKNIRTAKAAAIAMQQSGRSASWSDLLLRPVWSWLRCYILQRGFMDGFYGLVIANGQAHYTFLKYAFLSEIRASNRAAGNLP